jgi:hypothetical protein
MALNEFSNMPPERRAELGRKGGLKSAEVRKRKKETKEIIDIFLKMPLKNGKVADIDAIKNFMAIKGKNISVQQAIVLQLVQKALKGDLKAIEMLLALNGDKPIDKVQLEATVKNPMSELSAEELRQIIAMGEGKSADEV